MSASPIKIGVVGTGRMAHIRTRAFLSSSEVCEICCVASRTLSNAQVFAQQYNCQHYTNNYRDLLRFGPDAVLIEVPHLVQDAIALWALDSGLHVLIGGCLATNVAAGRKIAEIADRKTLVVETGYEARYKEVWRVARQHLNSGRLGATAAINTVALYDAAPDSWYYNEQQSGGMIVTHMTYAFINPIRWIFGPPLLVSAFSNSKRVTGVANVNHETCTANLLFNNGIICNMTASYVKPDPLNAWEVRILCTEGALEIEPGDLGPSSVRVYSDGNSILDESFPSGNNGFEEQAIVFLSAITGKNRCLNPAWDSLIDLKISEAIVESAETRVTVEVNSSA